MDLQCCRELIVLAEKLSFTDAAELLFISQSALSKHVAAAEREVGFRIFERSTVNVGLTDPGRALVEGLRTVVDAYDEALASARASLGSPVSTIRVVGPLVDERISTLVGQGRRQLIELQGTDVRLSIRDIGVRDGFDKLLDDSADIVVGYAYDSPSLHRRRLRIKRLMNVPFGVVCYADHPLARKPTLAFEDIAGTQLYSYPLEGRSRYHQFVARVCRRRGIEPPTEFGDVGSIPLPPSKDQVLFGVYYPDFATFGTDVVSRPVGYPPEDPLERSEDSFSLCLACRKNEKRPEVRALFDRIVDVAAGPDAAR